MHEATPSTCAKRHAHAARIMQVEGLRAAGALGGRAERLGAAVGAAQVRHDELTRSDGEEEEHQRLERADLPQYD